MLLGRSSECDLVVDDVSISRRHAELRLVNRGLEIADLGSRNGTFVGDSRIETSLVNPNQIVRFAEVAFVVTLREASLEGETDDPAFPPGRAKKRPSECEKQLSEAQRRVFQLLREGLPDKTIAKELHLSQHTVHNHTRAIFRVFGVHSRVQLLARLANTIGVWDEEAK